MIERKLADNMSGCNDLKITIGVEVTVPFLQYHDMTTFNK